jgi:hypothetical protein
MDIQPALSSNELLMLRDGDIAKAISERNDAHLTGSQVAVDMVLVFMPRDMIEASLAGHCVMFHELITDRIGETPRSEDDTMPRGARCELVALKKSFIGSPDRLERYQLGCARVAATI